MPEPLRPPAVTVLMAVYNGEAYLREAMESVLNQTLRDFEFLIVDDGSTDGGVGLIEAFRDGRVRLLKNARNLGLAESLNLGLEKALGRYVARMDADDVSDPARLEKQVAFLGRHPEIGILGTGIRFLGSKTGAVRFPADPKLAEIDLLFGNPLAHPSVMFRREAFDRHRLRYDSGQKFTEDYDLWTRASVHLKMSNLPEVLLSYRIHPGQQTRLRENIRASEGRAIMERQLLALGLRPSGKDMEIHWQIAAGEFPATPETLHRLETHLVAIMEANGSAGRYHPALLRKYLSARYYGALVKTVVNTGISPGQFFNAAATPILKLSGKIRVLRKYASQKLRGFRYSLDFSAGKLKGLWDSLRLRSPSSLFFFFPPPTLGGASVVHRGILESVGERKPWVFYAGKVRDGAAGPHPPPLPGIREVSRPLNGPRRRHFQLGYWSALIRRHPQPTVFGCNNLFFYELAGSLNGNARCIDLIHAFSPGGMEKASLNTAPLLSRRVVITPSVREDFRALYAAHGVDPDFLERIVVIENGVEVPPLFPGKPSGDRLEVLYAGRGTAEKRVHLIAEAAARCAGENVPAVFRFAGDVSEAIPGRFKRFCDLMQAVSGAGELARLYRAADILVMASSREGFPMAIMEAMAQGVVPLTTAVGGIPTHIRDGENGLLIRTEDENAIVEQIVAQIKRWSGERPSLLKLSRNAHEYAKNHFNKTAFSAKYRELLLQPPAKF